MTLERIARHPAVIVLATIGLALLSAYSLAVVNAGYALAPGPLAEAFWKGSYLGVPAAWFVLRMLGVAAATLTLGALAVGGAPDALGPWSSTPWRRLVVVLAPVTLSPWCLAQEDLARRPSFVAFAVALSVALAVRMRPGHTATEGRASPAREYAPVLAVMALHATAFTTLAVQRDQALWSATVDLGIFKEALWHTLHGRVMFSPAVGYSFFGEHFSPVLLALVPLYALWPTSACLLSVQTLAISASAWPLYRLSRDLGLSRALATALCAAMIFSPPMQTALLYDFHMDLLAVPALSWLVYALHKRTWWRAYLALALLVSVKEDMFIPGSAALLACALTGERRVAARSVAIGLVMVAYSFLAMFVIIRRFGPPPGVPVYMADPNAPRGGYKFLRNFRHLIGWGGPARMLLGQPVRYVLYAFTDARLTTLLGFLMPLGFLPLAARLRVVLLAPLGIVLLSDNPEIVSLRYHYSAIQHPGVFFAAAFGAMEWSSRSKNPLRAQQSLAAMVVTGAIVLQGMHPASVWARTHTTDRHVATAHTRAVDALVARVSPTARVTATTFVGPRFSNRPWGHFFPNGLQQADTVLLDLQRPAWPLDTKTRDEMLRSLLRQGWGAVAWDTGAVLLERNASTARNTDALRDLIARRRYEVEGTEWTDYGNCAERDPSASDGWARVVRPSDPRAPGFVVFGPFLRLFTGRYRATFRLRAEPWISREEPIGTIDVLVKGGLVIATQELLAETFPSAGWRDVNLDFNVDGPVVDDVELRVRTSKRWLLAADAVTLTSPDEQALMQALSTR